MTQCVYINYDTDSYVYCMYIVYDTDSIYMYMYVHMIYMYLIRLCIINY